MSIWTDQGRPDSAADLPARERRRLPDSAYLDGARRFPICGPGDVTRALSYLERMPPSTYLAGVRRLAAIARVRGIPVPPVLAATPTPTAALTAMTGQESTRGQGNRPCPRPAGAGPQTPRSNKRGERL